MFGGDLWTAAKGGNENGTDDVLPLKACRLALGPSSFLFSRYSGLFSQGKAAGA